MTTIPLVERLRILRACEPGCDGRCDFCPDEVGREAADLLSRLASPVDVALETTSEERADVRDRWKGCPYDAKWVLALLRDFDTLLAACAAKDAALAAEKERADAAGLAAKRRQDVIDNMKVEAKHYVETIGVGRAALATSEAARVKAEGRADKFEEALREIAAYDDTGGNERLAKTGSYGAFDEPGSVYAARAALKPTGDQT